MISLFFFFSPSICHCVLRAQIWEYGIIITIKLDKIFISITGSFKKDYNLKGDETKRLCAITNKAHRLEK